jgi:hypothetical protein
MSEAGIDTYKELFNSSLTLFEWALKEVREGRSIASLSETEDRYRVLAMSVLENLRKRRSIERERIAAL